MSNTPSALPASEMPTEIVLNGVTYRRVPDITTDPAVELLWRIKSIVATASCSHCMAVWAIRWLEGEKPEPPANLHEHF